MNTYAILTQDNEYKAVDTKTNVTYWVSKGWKQESIISAVSGGAALAEYIDGVKKPQPKAPAKPTMAHGYDSKPETTGNLEPVSTHGWGYALLVIGFIAAIMGIQELGDYRPSMSFINFAFGTAGVCEVVAIIMIIIGHVNNKTVQAHNLLIEKLSK